MKRWITGMIFTLGLAMPLIAMAAVEATACDCCPDCPGPEKCPCC